MKTLLVTIKSYVQQSTHKSLKNKVSQIKIRCDYVKSLCKVGDIFHKDSVYSKLRKKQALQGLREVLVCSDSAKVTTLESMSIPNLLGE